MKATVIVGTKEVSKELKQDTTQRNKVSLKIAGMQAVTLVRPR